MNLVSSTLLRISLKIRELYPSIHHIIISMIECRKCYCNFKPFLDCHCSYQIKFDTRNLSVHHKNHKWWLIHIFSKYLKIPRDILCVEKGKNRQWRLVEYTSLSVNSADRFTKRKRETDKNVMSVGGSQLARHAHTTVDSTNGLPFAFSFATVLSLATSAWRGQCVKITRFINIPFSVSPSLYFAVRFLASLREARSKCRSQSSGRFVCKKS